MTDPVIPAGARWRSSAKAIVLDPGATAMLMLHMHDPVEPGLGPWWELPGGGPEPGETSRAAVVRELAEETGLVVPPECVGPAVWRRRATYRWRGVRRWSDEVVHVVRLTRPAGALATRPLALDPEEADAVLGQRWWLVEDVLVRLGSGGEACYPGRLPDLLPAVLRADATGDTVDEPFERWC